MKIKDDKKPIRRKSIVLYVTIGLAVFLLLFVALYLYYQRAKTNPTTKVSEPSSSYVDYDEPTSSQKSNGESIKADKQTDAITSNEGNDSTNIIITATNINDSILQIRTQISAVDTSGTCRLTMTGPSNQIITQESSVQSLATTSTCMGFDHSTTNMEKGVWNIVINYIIGEHSGSASKNITIN